MRSLVGGEIVEFGLKYCHIISYMIQIKHYIMRSIKYIGELKNVFRHINETLEIRIQIKLKNRSNLWKTL